MRRGIVLLGLFLGLGFAHFILLDKAVGVHRRMKGSDNQMTVLPGPLLKVTSLEYDGLVADFLFLKAMVFIGGTLDRSTIPQVGFGEYVWLLRLLEATTHLDPYFYDPYYFGNAHLVWNGYSQGRYHPAAQGFPHAPDFLIRANNAHLDKGIRHRDWDSYLLFLNGFNHFYFFQDDTKAAEYLMEASRRTTSSPLLATLAARLAYQSNRTENAIVFLREIIDRTEDEAIRKNYLLRLEALNGVLLLERGVGDFEARFGRKPDSLKDLIENQIISKIPPDPYGGIFYLDDAGKIKTTSNFIKQ